MDFLLDLFRGWTFTATQEALLLALFIVGGMWACLSLFDAIDRWLTKRATRKRLRGLTKGADTVSPRWLREHKQGERVEYFGVSWQADALKSDSDKGAA
jgi:hypothetical protein